MGVPVARALDGGKRVAFKPALADRMVKDRGEMSRYLLRVCAEAGLRSIQRT
jgi:hypothetical protein